MPELRSLTLEEMASYNKLSSICFTYTTKPEDLAPKEMAPEKLRQVRGVIDDDGTLLGGMIMIEMDCRFEGNDCRFLGIGGVVTDPAERRRGVIRQIFEEGLPRLRNEGFVLSALYPFSHVFYRKFGYELGIVRRKAKFAPGSLRKDLHHAASIRRILPGEPDGGMKQVYEKYIADKNLAVIRDEEHWKSLRAGTPWENLKYSYVLYNEEKEPMAYWLGTMVKNEEGSTLTILDMAYTCRDGMESIFAMFSTMNEIGTIRAIMPMDIPLRFLMTDPYNVDEMTSCNGMVRVMDVEKVLALLPAPALKGSCTVEVTDKQIPENNGSFTIASDGEKLTVQRSVNAPDLKCTINGLSALAVGVMDLQGCLDARLAELVNADSKRFLAEYFRPRQQHLHNFF
ncbi:MAG: GNAT family N-acetyltransferase [Clostridiales bacterium]|nr:GNAT family N-acetyltransferase [Clostridiales bacterium]